MFIFIINALIKERTVTCYRQHIVEIQQQGTHHRLCPHGRLQIMVAMWSLETLIQFWTTKKMKDYNGHTITWFS